LFQIYNPKESSSETSVASPTLNQPVVHFVNCP